MNKKTTSSFLHILKIAVFVSALAGTILGSLVGCAPPKVEVEQKNPIVIEHKLNLESLEKYFTVKCKEELTVEDDVGTGVDESYEPTDGEIKDCVEEKVADFLEVVG